MFHFSLLLNIFTIIISILRIYEKNNSVFSLALKPPGLNIQIAM